MSAANSRTALISTTANNEGGTSDPAELRQEKFSEFLRTEKMKRYKRVPRVFGKRTP